MFSLFTFNEYPTLVLLITNLGFSRFKDTIRAPLYSTEKVSLFFEKISINSSFIDLLFLILSLLKEALLTLNHLNI